MPTLKTVNDLAGAMEQIAPLAGAESWDNVGLIVGDPAAGLTRAMLCIDLRLPVLAEAQRQRCEAVVAYHPPIFKDVRKLVAGMPAFEAARGGVAVYSPHTALDVVEGGTNDVLADALYLTQRVPLRERSTGGEKYLKLVTFAPADAVDRVADALFAAGAGRIGDYGECSFRCAGTGTFRGDEGTNPTVGRPGHREHAEEVRLETIVPAASAEAVVAALGESHPYEEPAYDLLPTRRVVAAGERGRVGLGRIGSFAQPVGRDVLVARLKRELKIDHALVAGPIDGFVTRIAVCAGSCGDLLDVAMDDGAELYLTGEMRHHDALRAAARGVTVVCVLHSNSERAALGRLRERLADALTDVDILLSEVDRDPFTVA